MCVLFGPVSAHILSHAAGPPAPTIAASTIDTHIGETGYLGTTVRPPGMPVASRVEGGRLELSHNGHTL